MQHTFKISDLAHYLSRTTNAPANTADYLILHFNSPHILKALPEEFKIDCVSIFMCLSDEINLRINFKPMTLTEGGVLVLNPNNLIELNMQERLKAEGYALFLPHEFLNLMSLDSNTLDYSNLRFSSPATITLKGKQFDITRRYFELLEVNKSTNLDNNVYSRNISRSLISALIYQLMNCASKVTEYSEDTPHLSGRRNYYVRDFMTLVMRHFKEEHSVGFYAEKLFISPKYLSLIIKETTNMTATEWIDHYLILEAKNLLRFSGRNIQQIAYDLNFKNQSSFGKYFKHQTGLSPSEFRKS